MLLSDHKQILRNMLSLQFLFALVLTFGLSARMSTAALTCPDGTTEKAGICIPVNNNSTDSILGSDSLVGLIKNVLNILLYIAGAISVLFVVIGGYQYLSSGGNEEAAEKGRKTVTNAIIGIVVVVLAFTIINVVVGTLAK